MSSRLIGALASLVLTILGLVLLLPDCASACSCGGGGSDKQMVEWALSHQGAVFSGEVVDVEDGPPIKMPSMGGIRLPSSTVTLRVSEVWKGPQQETLEMSTPSAGAICGYPFKEGQDYLVYAYGKGEPFKVDLCSGTKPLSKANADLALLGKLGEGEKLKDSGDALNDTSGVVPARATVLIAVLAMAASFLLVVRLVRTG